MADTQIQNTVTIVISGIAALAACIAFLALYIRSIHKKHDDEVKTMYATNQKLIIDLSEEHRKEIIDLHEEKTRLTREVIDAMNKNTAATEKLAGTIERNTFTVEDIRKFLASKLRGGG